MAIYLVILNVTLRVPLQINHWLVVSNMVFYFPCHIWDVIPTPLTNSIIFQDGEIAPPSSWFWPPETSTNSAFLLVILWKSGIATMRGPWSIAKLVQITLIARTYGRYKLHRTSCHGIRNQLITRGHHLVNPKKHPYFCWLY